MTTDTLVSASVFMQHLGIKKTKFYKSVQEGKLPKPIRLTDTKRVWPMSVIAEVIENIKNGKLSL